MKTATIDSVCECQARLGAELDEQRSVVHGWARDPRHHEKLVAPANSIDTGADVFQVGWMCPLCTRNTLRSFQRSALRYKEIERRASA